jgi:glycosyltransferase involved in cell wall biosynthesis
LRIAVLLAAPWIPGSVDMTEYIRVLRQQGHDALLICLDRAEGRGDFPVEAADRATLESAAFYRQLRLDAAIAFTWISSPRIVSAMKDAAVRVLLRGDSDGMISVRRFPRQALRVRMSAAKGILDRARAFKHWTRRYMIDWRAEDRDRLVCIEAADVTVLETAEAARNVAHFVRAGGRADLVSKLHVVPHFVADDFLTCDISQPRQQHVTCIGRWEDAQKNAPLLARAIDLHLSAEPGTSFAIIGPEQGRSEFGRLMEKFSQVKYLGPQSPAGVRRWLTASRVLLSSSRWEGAPVVANEALACGATVVGTPIPAFIDICGQGFGTVAHHHTARELADALDKELHAWTLGTRQPAEVAAFWRPRLSSRVVVGQLSELLSGGSMAAREIAGAAPATLVA